MLRRLILFTALLMTAAGAVTACSDVDTQGYGSDYQPVGHHYNRG